MTDSKQDGPARLSSGSQQHQPGAGGDGLLFHERVEQIIASG